MVASLNNEVWLPVTGYEGLYEVSNIGRVKSISRFNPEIKKRGHWRRDMILAPIIDKKGYVHSSLSSNGIMKRVKVHRMVASAFIPNEENKKTVNHINGNPSDNRVENLEWATYSEQQQHSYCILGKRSWAKGVLNGTHPNCKKVKCDTLGMVFLSATEAAKAVGGTKTDIVNYISGRRNNRYGLTFRYI